MVWTMRMAMVLVLAVGCSVGEGARCEAMARAMCKRQQICDKERYGQAGEDTSYCESVQYEACSKRPVRMFKQEECVAEIREWNCEFLGMSDRLPMECQP